MRKLIWLMGIVLTLSISCEEWVELQTTPEFELLNGAKSIYARLQSASTSSPSNAREGSSIKNAKKNPKWERASFRTLSFGADKVQGVVVPAQFEDNIVGKLKNGIEYSLSHLTYFLIYTYEGIDHVEVVTSLPTIRSAADKFSGLVIVETLAAEFIQGFVYKDGKVVSGYTPSINQNATASNGRESSDCVLIDWYQCWESSNGEWGCTYLDTQESCPVGSGGDGGGSTSGTSYSGNYSPSGSGGSTGGSGVSSSPSPTPLPEYEDSFNNLCGAYTFIPTGDGLSANITGLGATAYDSRTQKSLQPLWGSMCVTFGSSTGLTSSAGASTAFNAAWGTTMDQAEVWLNANGATATTATLGAYILKQLNINLQQVTGGYATAVGTACSGTVPSTLARYCN